MVRLILIAVLLLAVLGAAGLAYVRLTGLSALDAPGPLEARVARAVRTLAIPDEVRNRPNPVAASPDAVARGLEHYADHCTTCHANDGSGDTDFGRGLYPRPPDMRLGATQQLTDGEMFHIIQHGVRFTGMPGFATGHEGDEQDAWYLVHFLRRLPALTEPELERMHELNPRSVDQLRQELEEERFLRGES